MPGDHRSVVTIPYPRPGILGSGTEPAEERSRSLRARTRTKVVAWGLWLATMILCAAGLVVTLLVTRPLTVGVLAQGAAFAMAFPLGYATVGWCWGCGGRATRSGGYLRPRG